MRAVDCPADAEILAPLDDLDEVARAEPQVAALGQPDGPENPTFDEAPKRRRGDAQRLGRLPGRDELRKRDRAHARGTALVGASWQRPGTFAEVTRPRPPRLRLHTDPGRYVDVWIVEPDGTERPHNPPLTDEELERLFRRANLTRGSG